MEPNAQKPQQPVPHQPVQPQVPQTVEETSQLPKFLLSVLGVFIVLGLICVAYYLGTQKNATILSKEKTASVLKQSTVTVKNTSALIQNKILLAELSQKSTDLSLSVLDVSTKQQKQFITPDVNFQNPLSVAVLSPNHKLLLVPTNPNAPSAKGTIIIYTLATGSSITITNSQNSNQYTGNFVWSPDSTRIAFVSGGIEQSQQLYLVNADGTGLQQLTNDNDNLKINPVWSPDGEHLMYGSKTDQNSYIKEYNLSSRTTLNITPTNPQTKEIISAGVYFNDIYHTVGWIDNDHIFVFYSPKTPHIVTSNTGVWSVSLSTGELKQLVALPVTFGSQGILSEDRKMLSTYSFDTNSNKTTYYLVHLDGSVTESYTVGKAKSRYPFFSPDGKRLAYQDDSGFWVHDFTTNQNTKIMDLTQEPYTFVGATWSPDSTQVALKATIVGGAGGPPSTSPIEKNNEGFWLSNIDGSNLRKIDSTSTPLYWY